jgi:hypothetical protein
MRGPVRQHCNCNWRKAPDVDPLDETRRCDGILVEEEADPLDPVDVTAAHCPDCGSRFDFEEDRSAGDRCGTRICRHCGGLV